MVYRVLADSVLVAHLSFILFVLSGGLLVLRWRGIAWVHVPAALWGALLEFKGWICPLTPVENWLRARGGAPAYNTGFIEHYLLPIVYPVTLTREIQVVLGILVLAINVSVYSWVIRRRRKGRAL